MFLSNVRVRSKFEYTIFTLECTFSGVGVFLGMSKSFSRKLDEICLSQHGRRLTQYKLFKAKEVLLFLLDEFFFKKFHLVFFKIKMDLLKFLYLFLFEFGKCRICVVINKVADLTNIKWFGNCRKSIAMLITFTLYDVMTVTGLIADITFCARSLRCYIIGDVS